VKNYLLFITLISVPSAASNVDLWGGKDRLKKSTQSQVYTTTLHEDFAELKDEYEAGSNKHDHDQLDSFGMKQAVAYSQEYLLCGDNDRTFSQTVDEAYANSRRNDYSGEAKSDSSVVSLPPSSFNSAVKNTLMSNSTKGRFCLDHDNSSGKNSYSTGNDPDEAYCKKGTMLPTFTDFVTGLSCNLKLDVNLKRGETRFIRQLQTSSTPTIAQGYVSCYASSATGYGNVKTELIANPNTCTPSNRESCNYTCDWAESVVCDPVSMPRWGGGQCGGMGTLLFRNDTITIKSEDHLSYNLNTGRTYQGSAVMRCATIGDGVLWVVESQSCSAK
jgi:hypothetical protein